MPSQPAFNAASSQPDGNQIVWNDALAAHVAGLARDWFAEDLGHECDWTSVALVAASATCELDVVARQSGVVAGVQAAEVVALVADPKMHWQSRVQDGTAVEAGHTIATLGGATRSVLAAERVLLNMIGRMSGVATATRLLVDAVAGTPCRVYDTRKTVPGWRLLDKFATRAGGGWNHRLGLFDAVLIKDNHVAALAAEGIGPAEAVHRARAFIRDAFPPQRAAVMVVQIEVDSIQQCEAILSAGPDVLLLDNMTLQDLAHCVCLRNQRSPGIVLEASGGIRPETIRAVADTGVDRVSSGWPTHNAPWLDVALDWLGYEQKV